jgi:hypothetical protein
MLRRGLISAQRAVIALVLTCSVSGAILPERFGPYAQKEPGVVLGDDPIWKEYGFEEGVFATYSGSRTFKLTAYRFTDPTGAAAAFDWLRPPGSSRTSTANLSAAFAGGALVVFGNYLLRFDGWQPRSDDLVPLVQTLPKVNRGALPYVRSQLPERARLRGSERYILGPASLAEFEPRVPASVAAFEQSAEAAYAKYRTPAAEVSTLVFMYPTHQIAREKADDFAKLPGATVRRSGPLLGIVLAPTGVPYESVRPHAERLLAGVNYQAEYTETEHVPKDTVQDAARMILAIVLLALGLIVASVLLGFGFGAVRILARKYGINVADDSFTGLNLSGK